MLKVGFTGTAHSATPTGGMSAHQIAVVRAFLHNRFINSPGTDHQFHHGDCVGSDEQAHYIAARIGYKVIIHPCDITGMRSFCTGFAERKSPMAPLKRNQVIVGSVHELLACPKANHEELRSGTWATVRYARKLGRPILIVWPDGSCTFEPASKGLLK